MKNSISYLLLLLLLSGCSVAPKYLPASGPNARPFVFDPASRSQLDSDIRLVTLDRSIRYYPAAALLDLKDSKRWGKILVVRGPHYFHQYALATVKSLDRGTRGRQFDILSTLRGQTTASNASATNSVPDDCSPVPVTEGRRRTPSCIPGSCSSDPLCEAFDLTTIGPDGTDGWFPCKTGYDCGWDEGLGGFGIGEFNDPVSGFSCYIDFSSSLIYGCSDEQVSVTYSPSYPNLLARYYWYAPNSAQGRQSGRGEMQCQATPNGNGRFYAWVLTQTKSDGPPNLDEGIMSPDTASYWDLYTNIPTGQHQKASFWQYQPGQPLWKPWKKMKYVAYCEGGQ